MEPFKEKKIVNILDTLAVITFFLFIACMILAIFNDMFLLGILFIPLAALLIIISNILSDKDEYSIEFIDYMKNKLNNSSTLVELQNCLTEFENLATRDGMYDLKYPHDLRRMHEKIISQIEILQKQKS